MRSHPENGALHDPAETTLPAPPVRKFRRADDAFRWEDVPLKEYKPDGGTHFRDITRQTLFGEPEDLTSQLRYFEVGPGGHFFGTPHTQSRYKTAFYSPILSDWRNFESWSMSGSPTVMESANRVWKERLAAYEKPPIDPAIEEEILTVEGFDYDSVVQLIEASCPVCW